MIGNVWACAAVPLVGSCLLPLAGKIRRRLRNALALIFVTTAFVCAALCLPPLLRGQVLESYVALPLGLRFGLRADAAAVFMALAASLVGVAIVVYSYGYIAHDEYQNEYYFMVVLFIGAMMVLVFSTNLIAVYMFWEIAAVCCWRLIGFYRRKDCVRRAGKAYLITVGGALVMLVGFVAIYGLYGTFNLTALQGKPLPAWIVALILCGILSKSATFPLHSWLPDAGVAPSPATSLLHAAVLVKIGVYAYVRLFHLTFTIPQAFCVWVPAIAAVSALISAGAALREMDLKRVIAYSTISQLAFILAGLSVGNQTGLVGGMLYILNHSVAKGGLFLCAGIVEHALHTKDLSKMGGLAKTMPLTAASFLLCAFSVMGIPPFGGFFAKFMVIQSLFESGQAALGLVFLAAAVMTVLYLMRLFAKVFLGPAVNPEAREGSPAMVGSVIFLGALSLLLGLFTALPAGLAGMIGG